MNIQEYLATHHVDFESLSNEPTYDAQRLAQAVQLSGHQVAKTVLLRDNDRFYVAVLPATRDIDLPRVQRWLGVSSLQLASELQIAQRFPDCELGAIPPFGSHYGMTTLVDKSLSDKEDIVFETTTHDRAVRMRFSEYARLENPVVTSLSQADGC
jgi:Ala-tRNA(Pro) deacylase